VISNFQNVRSEWKTLRDVPLLAVSDYLRTEMIRFGYSPEAIAVVPSPAPVVAQNIPLSDFGVPRFLFMSRLVPEKGIQWLLDVLQHISVPIHIDVAGDGYFLNSAKTYAKELGVDSLVTFHGWVEDDVLKSLLQSARAVVFPSLWNEPAGLVTLEAAAYGRPVIASRVGGIPEYADPTFAALVEPGDVSGLAAAMEHLATDAVRAAAMGRAGRELATTRFSMEAYLDGLSAHYDAMLTPTPS